MASTSARPQRGAPALIPGPAVAALLLLLAGIALVVWLATGIAVPTVLLLSAILTFLVGIIDARRGAAPSAVGTGRSQPSYDPVPHSVGVVGGDDVRGISWLCTHPEFIWRVPGHVSGTVLLGDRPEHGGQWASRSEAVPSDAPAREGGELLKLRGRVVVRGPSTAVHALIRAMIVHLALSHPPGTWNLVPVAGASWMKALPHAEVTAPCSLTLTVDVPDGIPVSPGESAVVLNTHGASDTPPLTTTVRIDADLIGQVDHGDGDQRPFAGHGLAVAQAHSIASALRDRCARSITPSEVSP